MSSVSAIEKELKEIKVGLVKLKTTAKSADDLNPFQDKLRVIDNKRQDGKFVEKDGSIPAGQAMLHDLLSECYEIKDEIMEKVG